MANEGSARFLGNALAFAVGIILSLGSSYYLNNKSKIEALEKDVNEDGRVDAIYKTGDGRVNDYFIQREDGTFDRCSLILDQGYPFYKTLDSKFTYSPDGAVFDNEDILKSYNLTKVAVNQVTNVLPREPFLGKTVTNSWTKSREFWRNQQK